MDLVLVNGRKEWIAKFDAALWSMGMIGKLHIANGGITGAALDEIVVSGCAFVEHERRRRQRSSTGAVGSRTGGHMGGGAGMMAGW